MRFSVVLLLIALFWTGCSVQTAPDQPLAPSVETFYKAMQEQKLFKTQEAAYVHFYAGRFARFGDTAMPPYDYGMVTIKANTNSLCLEGAKQQRCFSVASMPAGYVLRDAKETLFLTPVIEPTPLYEPKNLFEAAYFGTPESLKAIEPECSYTHVNNEGSYPLIEAVRAKNYALFAPMIEGGHDLFSQNFAGYTALDTAIRMHDETAVALLLKHGATVQFRPCGELLETLLEPSMVEDKSVPTAITALLIEAGFNPSCQQSALLFGAITQKDHALLRLLFKHRVKTDAVSFERGDTPLMRAAAVGDETIVAMLLDYGVNVGAVDSYGQTALDYDSKYLEVKNPRIAKLLSDAGLKTGLVVTKNSHYREGMKLLEKQNYAKAFSWFEHYAKQYGETRFMQAALEAYMHVPAPDHAMCERAVALWSQLEPSMVEDKPQRQGAYYKKAIELYEKFVAAATDETALLRAVASMDRLYDAWIEGDEQLDLMEKKLQNLRRLGDASPLQRMDLSKNGMRFVGETLRSVPFGEGTLYYQDGARYVGQVITWKRHGKGKYTLSDGVIYDGTWDADRKQGKAFFTDASGAMYLGTFEADTLIGQPLLVRPAP